MIWYGSEDGSEDGGGVGAGTCADVGLGCESGDDVVAAVAVPDGGERLQL